PAITTTTAVDGPLLAAPSLGPSGDPSAPLPAGGAVATVVSLTDGDTLDVRFQDGSVATVRLIGVNAPESDECFAAEAAKVLGALAPVGATVGMTADVSDTDRHGRLLRYLWVGAMSV